MSTKDEVREASNKFYSGLNSMVNGKINAFADAWSHNNSVTTMHPIGGREVGWDAVKKSFDQVAKMASEGKVELKDQLIQNLRRCSVRSRNRAREIQTIRTRAQR